MEVDSNRRQMIVRTEGLTKLYGNKVGCEKICLSIPEGQIFGFLGPNGAGKSTFVKMLVGLIHPTSGEASILGRPLGDLSVRRRLGFLPENFSYQEFMTGEELLDFHGALCRMSKTERQERIPTVLKMVKLDEYGDRRIKAYSKGMQQRLGMACAFLADPDLMFLDEPTSALDPIGRREVREILLDLKNQGKTIFLNSHLLSEVEMVCDQVAIINKGRIITSGNLGELLTQVIEVDIRAEGLSDQALSELGQIARIIIDERPRIRLAINDVNEVPQLAEAIIVNHGRLYELNVRHHSLEDLFIELVEGDEKR